MKASALTALLIGASSIAFASGAQAQEVVFADNADLAAAALRGERVSQGAGVTQIRLASGAMLSFVEGAEFQLRPDGSVDLFKGNVTVTGAGKSDTLVRLGGQGTGKISGAGSSGSFSVPTDASGKTKATGRVLTGLASIANGREEKRFNAGQAWEVANGHPRLAAAVPPAPAPRMTPQREAQLAVQTPAPTASATPTPEPTPEPQVASISEGGPAAAAENGVPVVLGEALAAAGASGDIVSSGQRIEAAVANPALETFPSNDLAALVAYAARLETLYGGRPFNQAQADVIRAYLNYLASGRSQAQFLTVYAGLMVQFLDLVRSGAAPSSFGGTSLADINAFISYRSRTDGFAALSGQNRVLVDAYLAFVLGGGNADQFVARYTSLTSAYFAYLRSGGDPLAFQGATQATLSAYITFLNEAGLLGRLAETDRALLQAYLSSGGTAFIEQYRTALTAYFTYLQSGKLPSEYTGADPALLRQYLETLQASGLFEQVLGAQATFYAQYLAYLKQGGTVDGWQGLPYNVFNGYALALQAYYDFLAKGGLPSAYTALTQDEIRRYLAALRAVGANESFLGQLSSFYSAFFTYLANGGNPDLYTGLPVPPDYQAFADAVSAYVAYLQAGGVPSAYTGADLALLQQYLKALIDSGKLSTLLAGQAQFLTAYYAYLAGGGAPDGYSALPVYADYVTALEAYYAYIAAGGKPSAYTALTQAQILAYLKALTDAGVLAALFDGTTLAFIQSFYVYLAEGGNPDLFSGLPTGGGTGGSTGTRLTTYTGGFPSNAAGSKAIAGHNGNIQPANSTPTVNADGALETAGDIATLGARVTDIAGDSSAIVGRYYDGNARLKNSQFGFGTNNGMPYVVLAPKAGTLPVSGTVDYKVLAATHPVYADGRTAPGTFDAALTIGFSSNNRNLTYRTLGTIVMPETGGDVTYTFSTPNYANGQMQEVVYDTLGNYFFGNGMTGNGQGCVTGGTGCNISFYGDFAGQEQVNRLGLVYQTYGGSFSAGRIQGAVIFGKDGTLPGGSTAGGSAGNSGYAGGFTATSGIELYAALGSNGGGRFSGQELSVNADGSYTSTTAAIRGGTAKVTDIGGDSGGLVGRFHDGTVLVNGTATNPYGLNNGASYVLMAPMIGSLPVTGTIRYDIVSATRPVYDDGHTAPGTFAAKFAVGFGTTLTYAIDGTITMADATYTVRAGNPLTGQTVAPQVGSPTFFVVRPALTSTSICTSGCQLNMFGTFGGQNPEQRLGFAYHSIGTAAGKTITGAVLFGQEGTIGSSTNATSAPSGAGLRYLGSGIIYRSSNNADQGFVSGSLIYDAATVTLGSDGKPDSALLAPTTTYARGTATNADAGGAGGVIGWSRWTGGTVTYTTSAFSPTSGTEQVRSNGGYAQIWGQPLTNKPTTGTATYTMVGATAPVRADGSVVPGAVQDATLAVAFGTNRIGYESHVTVGGSSYVISTNGGTATPNVPLTSTGQFSTLTNSGSVQLNGFLAGNGASHAGVSYFIGSSSNGIAGVVGLAKAP